MDTEMTADELNDLMSEWTIPGLAKRLRLSPRVIGYYKAGQRRIPGPTAIAIRQVTKKAKKA